MMMHSSHLDPLPPNWGPLSRASRAVLRTDVHVPKEAMRLQRSFQQSISLQLFGREEDWLSHSGGEEWPRRDVSCVEGIRASPGKKMENA